MSKDFFFVITDRKVKKKKKAGAVSYLSIEQDVTEVPDDVWQFNYLFSALLKLGCDTVALTDVPAHL